jgi:hypothetical protein
MRAETDVTATGSQRSPICERKNDATARARTWDNLGNNQVLYQLSYGGANAFSHCQS